MHVETGLDGNCDICDTATDTILKQCSHEDKIRVMNTKTSTNFVPASFKFLPHTSIIYFLLLDMK